MEARTRLWVELGLISGVSYLWLVQINNSVGWWQILTIWSMFFFLSLFSASRKLPTIGLLLTATIACLGWLMVSRIDPQLGLLQWRGLMLGLFVYFIAILLPWDPLKYTYLYGITIFLLLLGTWIFGDEVGGAKAWLSIAGLRFQPIELARIFLLLFLAGFLEDNHRLLSLNAGTPKLRYWGPALVLMAGVFSLLAIQRDLGPALLFYLLFITLVLYRCYSRSALVIYLLSTVTGLGAAWVLFPHFQNRISIWIDPWRDPNNLGFQVIQGLFAVSAGGFFGKGLGLGTGDSIPAAHTDYIFALICEELGLLGAGAVLVFYLGLLYYGLKIAKQQTGKRQLFALGIVLLWGYQIFIVVGGILRIIPLSGMTLPFLSYGGTSLVVNLFLLGMLTKMGAVNGQAIANKGLKKMLMIMIGLFVFLGGMLTYWQMLRLDLNTHVNNPRTYAMYSQPRGNIYDRNGELLANGNRAYDVPVGLGQTIGYFHIRYGMSGLEQVYNSQLVNQQDLHLTIDLRLQKEIAALMAGYVGAAVVMVPQTGEVLAVHSAPGIDNNRLELNWDEYKNNPDSPFYNRALMGLYPPGSAIKPLLLAAAYQENATSPDTIWKDSGRIIFSGQEIRNYNGQSYGDISTHNALVYSANTVFAQLAVELKEQMIDYYQRFGLGKRPDFQLPVSSGNIGSVQLNALGWGHLGIGQGELLVTPLQMATAIGTIANNGVRVRPYLVSRLSGNIFTRRVTRQHQETQVITQRVAAQVRAAMVDAVNYGTAWRTQLPGIEIAGKTGTAENPSGEAHSWFVGFGSHSNSSVVVVVVIEHGGSGGGLATSIAREIFNTALNELDEKVIP